MNFFIFNNSFCLPENQPCEHTRQIINTTDILLFFLIDLNYSDRYLNLLPYTKGLKM